MGAIGEKAQDLRLATELEKSLIPVTGYTQRRGNRIVHVRAHDRLLDGAFKTDSILGRPYYTAIVHVSVPKNHGAFPGTHVADVQEIHPDGSATVNLHVEGMEEAVTRIDMRYVKANNDSEPLKPHAMAYLRDRAKNKRAKERAAAREAYRRQIKEEAAAMPRQKHPELDASHAAREEDRRWRPGTAGLGPGEDAGVRREQGIDPLGDLVKLQKEEKELLAEKAKHSFGTPRWRKVERRLNDVQFEIVLIKKEISSGRQLRRRPA